MSPSTHFRAISDAGPTSPSICVHQPGETQVHGEDKCSTYSGMFLKDTDFRTILSRSGECGTCLCRGGRCNTHLLWLSWQPLRSCKYRKSHQKDWLAVKEERYCHSSISLQIIWKGVSFKAYEELLSLPAIREEEPAPGHWRNIPGWHHRAGTQSRCSVLP